jgi:hypothetical protein
MHFKNGSSAGNSAYTQRRITSRAMVARGPILVFDQIAAPVPEIII